MWKTVLGYANGNTFANVKRKYRKLALKVHPNRNPGMDSEPFRRLKKAMENAELYFVPSSNTPKVQRTESQNARNARARQYREVRQQHEQKEYERWSAAHAAETAARNKERWYEVKYKGNPPPQYYDPGSSENRRKTPLNAHPLYKMLNNVEKKSTYARQYLNTLMGGNAKRIAYVKDQMQRDVAKIRAKINEEKRRQKTMNELESRPLKRALNRVAAASPYWWQAPATPRKSAINRLNLTTKRRG
jgi:curved DNA-binding protein CbpA